MYTSLYSVKEMVTFQVAACTCTCMYMYCIVIFKEHLGVVRW